MYKKLFCLGFLLLSVLFSSTVLAQTSEVRGKVADESGQPIAGASVVIKGQSTGVTSDATGVFVLPNALGKQIVVTAVGYDALQLNASNNIQITLKADSRLMSEVVVTGFGGATIKRELTGNIARVKSKEIEFLPTPTVDQALQGRAAGVFVNAQSGKLGQAVTVRVRGNSSISANSQPLYVLDGVPITSQSQSSYGGAMNPLADLNQNDIESIEVLKDASAGAIYGSRAANGVVLITTKKGKAGRTNV
ncbi:MAG: hypothetical protein RLZZ204_968, partial [Bacteroidota bacterium]